MNEIVGISQLTEEQIETDNNCETTNIQETSNISTIADTVDIYLNSGIIQENTNSEEGDGKVFFPSDIKMSLKVILDPLDVELLRNISEVNKITTKKTKNQTKSNAKNPSFKYMSAIMNTKPTPEDEKERLLQELVDRAVMIGVRNFFNEVDRSDMRLAISELGPKYHEDLNNAIANNGMPSNTESNSQISSAKISKNDDPEQVAKYTKSHLRERFRQYFEYLGAEDFLAGCSVNTLQNFCEALEFSEEDVSHRKLVDALLEEIFLYGAKELLSKCKKSVLMKCIRESRVCRLRKGVFCSKSDMVNILLRSEFAHLDQYVPNLDQLILPPGEEDEDDEDVNYVEDHEVDQQQQQQQQQQEAGTSSTPIKKKRGRPPKNPNTPKITPKKRSSTLPDEGPEKKKLKAESGGTGEEILETSNTLNVDFTIPRKRGRPKGSESKKDPNRKIEPGVTLQYLMEKFTHVEIMNWCKENKIKYYGPREKVLARVIQYFAGNKEGIMMDNKRGRKSKSFHEERMREEQGRIGTTSTTPCTQPSEISNAFIQFNLLSQKQAQ
jgi:hypothetical protein